VYLVRLSYEPRMGVNGDAALSAAREFNRRWVSLGMPQMRVLLSPFGPFGAPFVQLDVAIEDLAEAEAALTSLREQLDPLSTATTPAPTVEILRILDEPPIDDVQVARALRQTMSVPAAGPAGDTRANPATGATPRAEESGTD
jgi:hypothetical protein